MPLLTTLTFDRLHVKRYVFRPVGTLLNNIKIGHHFIKKSVSRIEVLLNWYFKMKKTPEIFWWFLSLKVRFWHFWTGICSYLISLKKISAFFVIIAILASLWNVFYQDLISIEGKDYAHCVIMSPLLFRRAW